MPRRSRPGRSDEGPSWPKTEMRTMTSRGSRSSGPMCQRSIVPGRKFSHTHVRGGAESSEEVLAVGLAQVDGAALAAATLDGPEQRMARPVVVGVDERTDLAHEVAGARAARP